MPTTKIVCLANSKKLNHRCFAGKELRPGNVIGDWIRPIDVSSNDSVRAASMSPDPTHLPNILDIVEVPLTLHKASYHQTENWLFNTATPWNTVGQFSRGDVRKLLDAPGTLWPDDSSAKGRNDRVPTPQAHAESKQSLYLIEATDIVLSKEVGFGQKAEYRVEFTYNGKGYDLGNTDLIVQAYLDSKPVPCRITSDTGVLCVSLTADFKGYCYKLVAGVIL